MADILLPQRYRRQPLQPAPVDRKGLGASLVGHWLASQNVPLLNAAVPGEFLVATGSPTFPIDKDMGRHVLLNGTSQYLRKTNFKGGNALPLSYVVKFRPDSLPSGNHTIMALTASGGTSVILYLYASNNSLFAVHYNSAGQAILSGVLQIGRTYTAAVVFENPSSRKLYLFDDGQFQVATDVTTGPSPAGINQIDIGASPWAGPGEFFAGAVGAPLIIARALVLDEIRTLAVNPWQVSRAPSQRMLGAVAAGGINLTGAPSTQANSSGTGAVAQTHMLSGAASTQANTSAAGAVSQTHVLAAAPSVQSNESSVGAGLQTHILVAAPCSQLNTSGTGAATQTHQLAGAPCTQVNESSTGPVDTSGQLVGAPSSQANESGVGAVVQTHQLTTSASTQVNGSTGGVMSQVHQLVGAACTQINLSSVGAVFGPPDAVIIPPGNIVVLEPDNRIAVVYPENRILTIY